MYQHTVLHPAPEFTVAQWKAASAHHEYEAKRLTVEAQQHITAAQRTQQHNEHLEAKAARCTLVINEKTTMITKLQMQLKMQQELVAATEKSRIELQKKASAAAEASTVLRMRLEKTEASCIRLMNEAADREKNAHCPYARGKATPQILTTHHRGFPQKEAEAEEKENC